MGQTQEGRLYNDDTLFNCTQYIQRPLFSLLSHSTVSSWHPDMVQMHFETVSQNKPSVALNNIPQYVPDHIRFKLGPAPQTNSNHFILYILSVADSQPHEIPTRHFIK
jgi:hypothetical protein